MREAIELLILDSSSPYLDARITDTTFVVMWNSFSVPESINPNSVISLPQYVETNSERLKERFLSFVDQVGSSEVSARSVIEHLMMSSNFSYWWITLFACKRWVDSSNIIEAVRLLALEEILASKNLKIISMQISDQRVKKVVRNWAKSNSIEFREISENQRKNRKRKNRISLLPRPMKAALVLLREIVGRRKLAIANSHLGAPVDTVLVDHFSKFDVAATERGEFVSGFWGRLLDDDLLSGHRFAFVHNFALSTSTPTRLAANELLAKFNGRTDQAPHTLFDSRIQAKTVFVVVAMYLRLVRARFRIRSVRRRFTPSESAMDLWPLFKREWFDSLSGSTAMRHSILINDLELAVRNIPPCKRIIYLMENQPWEMAFLQIFRNHRREPLVGYPHSTIRYWDLRYWTSLHKLSQNAYSLPPTPNEVVANGPATRAALESSGFQFQRISDVEALAFLYLGDATKFYMGKSAQRLLVLGDFFSAQNTALLNLLSQVDIDIRSRFITVLKPHPLCQIDEQWITELNLMVDARPLSDLLPGCDVVISTNGTSAAAEAHQFGIKVITILNGDMPNFSPLRGVPNAFFVASSRELQEALATERVSSMPTRNEYFSVDSSLTGWHELLSNN